ncbi:MAG: hypothetical protein RSC24_14820 [Clostridium sp.]
MIEELDNKLRSVIEEKNDLENRIKQAEEEIKSIKENMIMNSMLDLKVEFEEDSGVEYYKSLDYNIYIIRNNIREVVLEEVYYKYFIEIDMSNKYDYIINKLNKNKTLVKEEIDKILAECLKFRESVIIRKEQHYSDWKKAKERSKNGNIDLQVSDSVKDLRKEFIISGYKFLAKKYHPDTRNGDEDKFKELSAFKNKLLEIYELK